MKCPICKENLDTSGSCINFKCLYYGHKIHTDDSTSSEPIKISDISEICDNLKDRFIFEGVVIETCHICKGFPIRMVCYGDMPYEKCCDECDGNGYLEVEDD